jgi:1-acyl-sn-glycerol-3-phosphate acyltransferase
LRRQGIVRIEVEGEKRVAEAIQAGCGVLLVSNHSYHYDSYVLIEAGLRGGWHPQIMTAWQVFHLYSRLGQMMLQRHGCFSINREGTDKQAFRQAVEVLLAGRSPLVVFPEGDIYHSNDRVMPFREGAAAIALIAAKKKRRPLVVIPCAMKCFYTADPHLELCRMMSRLEAHIRWRPEPDIPLLDRIYRFGNGFLSLKEVEYLGRSRFGSVRERLTHLSDAILTRIQQRHGLRHETGDVFRRIRSLRVQLIRLIDEVRQPFHERKRSLAAEQQLRHLHADMEDLFFVTQLTSYHGDYSSEKPTVERMAETIDKFEEDVFGLQAPTPRGRRRAVVRFGEAMPLEPPLPSTLELTLLFERAVQELLDGVNRDHDKDHFA